MPVLSVGGMRFQQSWSDLPADEITAGSQENLRAILERAVAVGGHHIETARGYGSSERQLGWLLGEVPDPQRILQSKVPPDPDPAVFERNLALSVERLGLEARGERLDLLALHGVNNAELLEQVLRPGGCLEVARRWQAAGRIGHIGLSTHAPLPVLLEAIHSDSFDYINLHWYFIRQDNSPALAAAQAHDMGVFVISPTDKGGHLHTPAPRFKALCEPLHPIIFNDLFCLSAPEIHTISVGAARPSDLDLHLEAVALLSQAERLLPPILERLEDARRQALDASWLASWDQGLPEWDETPGGLNLPMLLWLHNLLEAWGLEAYCRARYQLLGAGGHWFPGENADGFETQVSEQELRVALAASPWVEQIPDLLRSLRQRLGGEQQQRLSAGG
ncbi:MAG: aldo/keto reductase [Synechococcaceae cyanobacterium ELA739]